MWQDFCLSLLLLYFLYGFYARAAGGPAIIKLNSVLFIFHTSRLVFILTVLVAHFVPIVGQMTLIFELVSRWLDLGVDWRSYDALCITTCLSRNKASRTAPMFQWTLNASRNISTLPPTLITFRPSIYKRLRRLKSLLTRRLWGTASNSVLFPVGSRSVAMYEQCVIISLAHCRVKWNV